MRGGFLIVTVAVLAVLGIASSWRSLPNIIRLNRMKTEEKRLRAGMEKERNRLRLEVYRLTNDSLYIESIARKEYGMVRKGEEVFNVPSTDSTGGKKPHGDR